MWLVKSAVGCRASSNAAFSLLYVPLQVLYKPINSYKAHILLTDLFVAHDVRN
jgi:hypothetical protein